MTRLAIVVVGLLVGCSPTPTKPHMEGLHGGAVFKLDGHTFFSTFNDTAWNTMVYHSKSCPCGWYDACKAQEVAP
jgi:hypothetical protein